ncbi:MAG: sigma-70 family RNA polymerase sigma factor [Actinobacteria bacterium]|nr:sigma-70 family RNA polymerase sigma factor [Actinomycetota bacterium]
MDDDLEAELVDKAKRGDPSAGPFLVSFYGERLLGYARGHAPDLSDADREHIVELAIEAGVRAMRSFDPAKGTLRSWFRTQVRYKTLAWRRSTPPTSELAPELAEPTIDTTPPDPAITDALHRAIARLSHDDQVVLALRDAERLDYCEIAQRLTINEATARQRHSRARKRLRDEARGEAALHHLDEEMN